jgi:hypothetical protein
MTEAEEHDLFARLERLERSAWRWRAFASILAVFFLLLLSLGLVSYAALRNEAVERQRLADVEAREAEQRARAAADEAALRQRVAEEQRRVNEAEARRRGGQGAKGQVEEAHPQPPAGDKPQGP